MKIGKWHVNWTEALGFRMGYWRQPDLFGPRIHVVEFGKYKVTFWRER